MNKTKGYCERLCVWLLVISSILAIVLVKYGSFTTSMKYFLLPFAGMYGIFFMVFVLILVVMFMAWFLSWTKSKPVVKENK